MAHTYASVPEWKRAIVSGGTNYGTADDAELLSTLESVSRSIDEYCARTGPEHLVSGFGPRIGTNRYDGAGESSIEFDDDLLSITTLTLLDATNGSAIGSAAENTDFFLRPYDRAFYRSLEFHGEGSITAVGSGRRISSVAGKWGYQDVRVTSTTTVASGLASDAAATTFTTSATPTIEIGQTLYIGTEQLYLTALSGTTATVERGANGTTAAVHANASAIDVFRYPPAIVRACILATTRRRRMSEAGLTGEMGGGELPIQVQRDTERSIFGNVIWQFKLVWA